MCCAHFQLYISVFWTQVALHDLQYIIKIVYLIQSAAVAPQFILFEPRFFSFVLF